MLLATPAIATQNDEQARALYTEGVALFKAEKYSEAAKRFQGAYDLDSSPILLYNLARAHERAGNAYAAITQYNLYLKRFPKADDRAAVEDRIKILEAVRKQAQFGRLRIKGHPQGGSHVLIDGTLLHPSSDGTFKVKAGQRTVAVVTKESTLTQDVVVTGSGTTVIDWPPPSVKKSGKVSIPKTPPTTQADAEPRAPTQEGASGLKIGGWSLIGGGAVVAGLGGYFFSQAYSATETYNNLQADLRDPNLRPLQRKKLLDERSAAVDDRDRNATLSYITWGVSGAAIATGITLLILDSGGTHTAWIPTPGGAAFVGRF